MGLTYALRTKIPSLCVAVDRKAGAVLGGAHSGHVANPQSCPHRTECCGLRSFLRSIVMLSCIIKTQEKYST